MVGADDDGSVLKPSGAHAKGKGFGRFLGTSACSTPLRSLCVARESVIIISAKQIKVREWRSRASVNEHARRVCVADVKQSRVRVCVVVTSLGIQEAARGPLKGPMGI